MAAAAAAKRWTMLMWPYILDAASVRRIIIAHESFHLIQPALGLEAPDRPAGRRHNPADRLTPRRLASGFV
jgi:hypothetical protein